MSRPCSGKGVWRTKRDAKRGAKRIRKAGGQKPYRCPSCGEWHLTSMTLTEQIKKGYVRED